MHRVAAVACLAGGTYVLAGPGWALLVLGILVWLHAPRDASPRLEEAATRVRELANRARRMPRRAAAITTMTAGCLGVPAGILLTAGAGTAVLTSGAILIGVGLLTGWNA